MSGYKMLHVPDVTTATEQQEEGRVMRGRRKGEREIEIEGERESKTKTKEGREGGRDAEPRPAQPATS